MEPRFSATNKMEESGMVYTIWDRSNEVATTSSRDYAYMIVHALNASDQKEKKSGRNVGNYSEEINS